MATPAPTTTEAPTAEEQLRQFNCETPSCPHPYRFVSLFVGDSQAHYHCPPCWVAWNAAIIRGLIAQGLLPAPGE